MPVANINDNELYYTIAGRGIPCLMMHGGLGLNHTYMLNGFRPIEDTLEMIHYDHRGNGRSGSPDPATLTHEQFAADADALATHLGYEKVAVLGHSYGGFIALEMAVRYPERISHLILFDTAASMDYGEEIQANIQRKKPSPEILQALQMSPANNEEFAANLAGIAPLYFKHFDPELADSLLKDTIFRLEGRPTEEEQQAYNVKDLLSEINIPTLILVGREDFICPPLQAQILHDGIPDSELIIFEDSGHFPNIEEPDLFFNVLRDWLAGLS